MAIHTAVLIETLKDLGSDLCWSSCKIFSTQDHYAASSTHDESAAVFYWKGDIFNDYWQCIINTFICPEYYGKGHGPDLIVENSGDTTLTIHEDKKAYDMFLKDGTIPDPRSAENSEFNNIMTIIKHLLDGGETNK